MSDLSRVLAVGRSALNAQQSRLEVSQHNIANASTPGYVRQRVDMVTLGGQYANGIRGVRGDGPYSVRTAMYDREIAYQQGQQSFQSSVSESGSALEASLFPDAEGRTALRMGEFFDALGSLSPNPSNGPRRREVMARAEDIATSFQRDAASIQREMTSLSLTLESDVEELNQNLEDIAALDKQIAGFAGAKVPPEDLIDLRDTLVAQVAQAVNVEVVPADDGSVQLVTVDGRALIEGGNPREIGLKRTGDRLDLTIKGVAGDQPLAEPGGTIGGRLSAHNDTALGMLDELNIQASEFADAVNAVHNAGFGLDGVSGRNLFDYSGAGGAAENMRIDAAVAGNSDALATSGTGAPGDNQTLRAIMDVRGNPLPNGTTPEDGMRAMQQALGETIAVADRQMNVAEAAVAQLESFRDSVEGVSLEEEMLNLLEAQRGFDAALKVVAATDEMFNSLMNMTR